MASKMSSERDGTGLGPSQVAIEQRFATPLAQETCHAGGLNELSGEARPRPNPSRRRDKPQLSCHLCRRRKLRCDRKHPCSSCASRGVPCAYSDRPTTSSALPKSASMYDRIVQLERLVMSLVPGSTPSSVVDPSQTPDVPLGIDPSPASRDLLTPAETAPLMPTTETPTPLEVRSECGSMRVSASELRYVGGDHWAAILDNIADLKDHFDREEQFRLAQEDSNPTATDHAERHQAEPRSEHALLLYGCPLPKSRAEMLATLPPRSAVDRYISRYFNRLDLVHSIVHGPTFLQQYEAFWADDTSVPIVWVGMLFSMICLALQASDASDTAHGDPEHRTLQIEIYREKTVQCLLLGEYTKCGPHVLETVIHYVYIELGLRGDADKDIWFLFALEVSLAMRMGYHRDPRHFPGITPLQAEMRRRLWATVLQGDVLVCSQMGMPRMICDSKYDTAEPRNLNDSELTEDTAELPPPRPETELTPALGIIARRRMFVALGAISDVTAAVQPPTYTEIMKADAILHQAASSIPPPLQPKPLTSSMTDAPEVIMARLFLAHLQYKGQMLLHRRFLLLPSASPPSPDDDDGEDAFVYSRNACLDAAVGALRIQEVLDAETGPGGQLHMMRWRLSSIMNHTFLTATMVLCSAVCCGRTMEREEEILGVLRRTRTVWMRASGGSREAKKAAETVSFVIARAAEGARFGNDPQGGPGKRSDRPSASVGGSSGRERSPDARTLDLLLQGGSTGSTENSFFEHRFVMPGLLGRFTPADFQTPPFSFTTGPESDGVDFDTTPDEWMEINDGP